MSQVSWAAAPDGRYWIDILVGSRPLRFLIDLGLVDPAQAVGLEVEPHVFDSLQQAGDLVGAGARTWRDATGRLHSVASGWARVQLLDPATAFGIGPTVRLFITRGFPAVPNRVGVVFFHRLSGCSVLWQLDQRSWCVNIP
jgi:hypothetical protein